MTTDKLPIITEAGFFDKLSAAIAADPRSNDPSKSYQSQLMAIQQNRQVGAMADMLYNAWAGRYVQLMRAAGNQSLNDKNYTTEFTAFIESNLLPPNTKIVQLNNSAQIRQAITAVVAARNNSDSLKKAFETVIDLTAVSRATKSVPAARSRQAPATTTATQTQQMQNAINNVLSGSQQKALTQILATNPGATVRSTGDAQLDAFLKVMGIRVS